MEAVLRPQEAIHWQEARRGFALPPAAQMPEFPQQVPSEQQGLPLQPAGQALLAQRRGQGLALSGLPAGPQLSDWPAATGAAPYSIPYSVPDLIPWALWSRPRQQ